MKNFIFIIHFLIEKNLFLKNISINILENYYDYLIYCNNI